MLASPVVRPAFRTTDPPLPARLPIVSAVLTCSVPAVVAVELTTTAPVLAMAFPPDSAKMPFVTVVTPVNVLAPDRVSVPVPIFWMPLAPEITPLNAPLPMLRLPPDSVTAPVPP